MSELEQAVMERRVKALEEEVRVNKEFRKYVMKRFAELSGDATKIEDVVASVARKER